MERGGAQIIQIVVQIILARLLGPNEFGTMAIVLVFINLSRVFIEGGFNVALIQKKNTDNLDYSSIYVLSLIISVILFLVLYIFSPYISNFYGQPDLTTILRISGILLFPGALNTVQDSYVAKNQLFKKAALVSLTANLISGIVGIIVAYLNFGIWALITQQILASYIYSYLLQWKINWKPKLVISWVRVQNLFSYGSRILGSSLIYRLYLESRTLIIGKVFSPADLGFYQRGEQIPKVLVGNIDGSIQAVMLPTLSANQEDLETIKSMIRRSLKISTFVIFPMMFGLAAVSNNLFYILLGEKWADASSYLAIFSLTYALWPLITLNQQSVRALGRSDIILNTEIIKRVIGIIIILVSVRFGVKTIAWGFLIERLVETFINAWPNKKLINYGYFQQVKDISPSFVISILMYFCIIILNLLQLNLVFKLFIQIIMGLCVYFMLALITKNESFIYLLNLINTQRRKKNNTF